MASTPAMDEIRMRLACSRSSRGRLRMRRAASRASQTEPKRFCFMSASQSSSETSKPKGARDRPTFAMAQCRGPSFSSAASSAAAISADAVMSPATVKRFSGFTPSAISASRASSSDFSPRAAMPTFAPSAAKVRAMPKPMPRLAPAMKMCLPVSSRFMRPSDVPSAERLTAGARLRQRNGAMLAARVARGGATGMGENT